MKSSPGNRIWPIATLLLGLALPWPGFAQDQGSAWVIHQILDDTVQENLYYSKWEAGKEPLFWPPDLGYANEVHTGSIDPLFRVHKDLLYVVESTGRVYRIGRKGAGLSFNRIDETVFTGYNYGALIFPMNDTIWSYGGYGFWQSNGHLRFFSSSSKGWEIMPVNMMVPYMTTDQTNFLDRLHRKLYVVSQPQLNDGLRKDIRALQRPKDSLKLMALDLKTKNWSVSGIIEDQAWDKLMSTEYRMDLPWGKLAIQGSKTGFRGYCFDFHGNRILQAKDMGLTARIYDDRYSGRNAQQFPGRILTWFNQDTLHIINDLKKHYRIPIRLEDFNDTGLRIFGPTPPAPAISAMGWAWSALISGLVAMVVGLVLYVKSRRLVAEMQSSGDFTAQEKELLLAFLNNAQSTLDTEAIDFILGSKGRSLDTIKKRRSSAIRSVNEKYSERSGDPEQLIVATRKESDRRMVLYGIPSDKTSRLRKLIG